LGALEETCERDCLSEYHDPSSQMEKGRVRPRDEGGAEVMRGQYIHVMDRGDGLKCCALHERTTAG
jgi:hypothetical protein